MTDLPTVMTKAGLQPQSPASLLEQLLESVASTNPGYTANLPGSLIEDVSSTDVGALVICDAARVELVNSLTPYAANPFLLNQLGQIYGVQIGEATNTSVYCVFTGTVGFVIAKGFTVSDGTHQYVVQDGGIIGAGGVSSALYCVASATGSWAVAQNTVTTLITSVPGSVTLSVDNPEPGTPGAGEETESSYRSRVLQAGLAAAQGMSRFLKTLLANVTDVQPRLISVQQADGGGWKVICGGGDPYEVAYAIFTALFDISSLQPSVTSVTGITQANPGVVTTDLNHGLITGQSDVYLADVLGMTGANGGPYTVIVIDEKTFSFGVDTSGFGAYTSGGVVTPNDRNISVTINDYPDTYDIPFINPPQQTVAISATWNTTSTNVVSSTAISQAAAPALTDYINALAVGEPINEFELISVFQAAISDILEPALLTRLIFEVQINGVVTPVDAGTGIIAGDPESYFYMLQTDATIVQG